MYLADHARLTPEKPAMISADTGAKVTYAELDAASNRLAQFLHAQGFRRGDHIAVLMENNLRFMEPVWTAFRSGFYVTTVNRYLPPDEAAYIIGDCGAKALITSFAKRETAEALLGLIPNCPVRLMLDGTIAGYQSYEDALASAPAEPLAQEWMGDSMLYSSGTTGRPKGILRPLPEVTPAEGFATRQMVNRYGLTADSVYLSPAPLYHAAPLAYVLSVQSFGGTVIIPKPIDRSYIRASVPGQFAFSEINSTEGSPFLLKLEEDQQLQVLCVDAGGKPVKGMHVGVTVPFVKEIKEPLDTEKELWLIDGVTGDDGIAHLEHMQWWADAPLKEARENLANARVAVTPIFPEFIRTKVNLEDPPKTPIKLVVPPTGRVIVPVPKNMLTYARVRVSIPGVDREKRAWPLKVPYRVDGRDTGVAVFEHVALNAEIEYEVWWQGLGAPRRGVAKGPKTAGEEITLPRLDSFEDGSKPAQPAQPPKKKS